MPSAVLTEERIKEHLKNLPGWTYENGFLKTTYSFCDFSQAWGFMSRCALLFEKHNHHPDWSNSYKRLEIKLTTHEAGGVTEIDFFLARQISELKA